MLSDFQNIVDDYVRDEAGEISTESRDRAIGLAVARYSTDRPRPALAQIEAVAGDLQPLPAEWDDAFSALSWVKSADGAPLPAAVELTLDGERIRLGASVEAGADMTVAFNRLHEVSEATDTVPFRDREAVGCWAASLLLEQLASLYSGAQQSTLDADAVNFQSKGAEFARRAGRMRQHYLDQLGIDPKRNVASGVVTDLDQRASDGGRRLFKRGIWR